MVEYNDGYECRVYAPRGGFSEKKGHLIRVIPPNPRPGSKIAKISEEDLDLVLNGRGVGRPFSRGYPSKVSQVIRRYHDN